MKVIPSIVMKKKAPNLDQFYFFENKNVTPPSYRNKIQLQCDKYLQFGFFCLFKEHVPS